MAKEEKEKAKKTKRATPLKRDDQSRKRRLINRGYKSRVHTVIASFEEILAKKDSKLITEKLNEVYSLLDKCVKSGVFKINKASRTKSRLAAKALAK